MATRCHLLGWELGVFHRLVVSCHGSAFPKFDLDLVGNHGLRQRYICNLSSLYPTDDIVPKGAFPGHLLGLSVFFFFFFKGETTFKIWTFSGLG